jgi:hypothetical protein
MACVFGTSDTSICANETFSRHSTRTPFSCARRNNVRTSSPMTKLPGSHHYHDWRDVVVLPARRPPPSNIRIMSSSYPIRPIKPSLSKQLDQFEFTNSCEERASQLLAVTCIPTHRVTRTIMRWPERHLAGGLLDGEPACGGYKHQSHNDEDMPAGAAPTFPRHRCCYRHDRARSLHRSHSLVLPRSNHESDSSHGSDQRRDCRQRTRQQSARHPRPLQKSRYQSRSSWFTRSSDEESETHMEIERNVFC